MSAADRVADALIGGVGRLAHSVQRRQGGGTGDPARSNRWLAITIFAAPDVVAPGGVLPAPLAELGDAVETRVQPAPADKGTELAARVREVAAGTDESATEGAATESSDTGGAATEGTAGDDVVARREQIRVALRRSKQLVEIGEVLTLEPHPHGKRTATPVGKVLEAATDHADREGIL